MTASTRQESPGFNSYTSDVVVVADTINIEGLQASYPHCFVGVQFFADAAGAASATPGAGTVAVTVETLNSVGIFEAVPDNTIDATAPHTVSWDANTTKVRLTPTGLTTATHWRAVVTINKN